MAQDIRECGSKTFNSGISSCPVPRGKVKALIFVQSGYALPQAITADAIETAIHADRPDRIYPVKTIEEFAPSGGEAQTSQQGYGANKVTSYSARTDTFTLDIYDMGFRANVVEAKDSKFDVFFVNDSNTIFGQRSDTDTLLHGIPLSGIYVGGQDFDSSGQNSYLTVNLMYSDIERHFKLEDVRTVDFDILGSLYGLVEVDFVSAGTTGKYKLIEHYGRLDITANFGTAIAAGSSTVVPGASAVTYADGVLSLTGTAKLAKPSVLSEKGILGIEQFS